MFWCRKRLPFSIHIYLLLYYFLHNLIFKMTKPVFLEVLVTLDQMLHILYSFLCPGVFVIYCCVTNNPQWNGFNSHTFIINQHGTGAEILTQLTSQDFSKGCSQDVSPGSLPRLHSRKRLGAHLLPRELTWVLAGLRSLLAVVCRLRFLSPRSSPQGSSQLDTWFPLE